MCTLKTWWYEGGQEQKVIRACCRGCWWRAPAAAEKNCSALLLSPALCCSALKSCCWCTAVKHCFALLLLLLLMTKGRVWIRVAELGSLSSGAKMAMRIFVKRVFTIFATNASFLRVIANLQRGSPLCSSSEQGGSKRLLEEFFWKSDHTVVSSLAANGENV